MKKTRGKLLVGQSGGCTHVINASLRGVVEEARRRRSIAAIWGMRHGVEGILGRDIVNLGRETPESIRRIGRCPAAALGSCRRKVSRSEINEIIQFLRANDITHLIYIGGNDSAQTAHRISIAAAREIATNVVAVPKTIDNDLPGTDHCPGFGSAARFIASVVADTGMETEGMRTVEPVKIIEVMGRNAGWLAASAALARRSERDAPQIIWPPEVPFQARKFLRLVKYWLGRMGYCVAVVSETIRDAHGRPIAGRRTAIETDAFGHPRTAGAAEYLCNLVGKKLGVRARWDKPGTIQRTSSAHFSQVDLKEAEACGRWAVRFALRGRSDCMVVMRRRRGRGYRVDYATAPLADIANRERPLPDSFFDRERMLPTPAFRRYALPLVGSGLPEHRRLKAHRVRCKSWQIDGECRMDIRS